MRKASLFAAFGAGPLSGRVEAIIITFLGLLFVVLATTSVATKSPTVDEPLHLFAGYSYLKWADYWVNPEHPPLVKILAALPLLALDIKDSRDSITFDRQTPQSDTGDPPAVGVAQKMLFVDNDADTLFFYARLPINFLALLLGFFVYLWSRDLFGPEAAIVSTLFYALDPNILAHSSAIQTDLPFAAFFFIGTYYFWSTLIHPAWKNLLLTALAFGLAAVTKHSFPVVFLIWGVIGLVWVLSSKPQERSIASTDTPFRHWSKSGIVLVTLLAASITAYFFIWAAYGFNFHTTPGIGQPLQVERWMSDSWFLQDCVHLLNHYRIFPEAWTAGQLFALERLSRVSYLFGEISAQGFWLYFPAVFAVKTPLPTLLLSSVVLVRFFFGPKRHCFFLIIPVILFFALGAWSRLNIGMRHILPIYPFLFVLIGGTAVELWRNKDRWKTGGLILLIAYYLISSFSIYPHYLAFFNELAGGPKNGHRALLDSNLDWGQDLKGLKRWMDDNGVRKVHLMYFGKADPRYYGIDAFYLPGSWVIRDSANNDLPSYLAVSANFVYGGKLFLTKAELDFLQSLQAGKPIADIGYSILVYKVDQHDPQISNNVGLVLARRGHLDKAVELFRRALSIQPEFVAAHQNLARVLTFQGNRSEAIYHYEEALRIMKAQPQR
jgi:Dolichyl-phosphate-mannose-protein mannosyltransferase/Tetratricopeptide repeat